MSQGNLTRLTSEELLKQQQEKAREYSRSIERMSDLTARRQLLQMACALPELAHRLAAVACGTAQGTEPRRAA